MHEAYNTQQFNISFPCIQVNNLEATEPGLDPKEVEVAKGTIAYTITNLQQGKFYRILLFAENTFGVSDEAAINIAMPGGIPLVPTTKYRKFVSLFLCLI